MITARESDMNWQEKKKSLESRLQAVYYRAFLLTVIPDRMKAGRQTHYAAEKIYLENCSSIYVYGNWI